MTMGSWRRGLRTFAFGWGMLQFLLPLVILFGDAESAVAGASSRTTTHVETPGANKCQPVHADECALCRFLSHNTAPTPRSELLPVATSAASAPREVPRAPHAAEVRLLPDSRAPPIA